MLIEKGWEILNGAYGAIQRHALLRLIALGVVVVVGCYLFVAATKAIALGAVALALLGLIGYSLEKIEGGLSF